MMEMVCLDLDGTLLPPTGPMTERNIECLRDAHKKGVKIVIASGRRFGSIEPHARQLGFNMPIIAYSGAWVKNLDDEEPTIKSNTPWEPTVELIKRLKGNVDLIGIYVDDMLYLDDANEYSERYEKRVSLKAVLVDNLSEHFENKKQDITKMLVVENKTDYLDSIYTQMKKEYAGVLDFVLSWSTFMEVGTVGVSKGGALSVWAEQNSIDLSRSVAFGDQENDLSTFGVCGVSVAMGNATDQVKEMANIVAPPNSEDGVAQVLERMLAC